MTWATCQSDNTETEKSDLASPDLRVTSTADLASPMEDLAPPADMSLGPPREFIVVRVGDGVAALGTAAAPVTIERRQISDGALSLPPIALPTTVSGNQRRFTVTGNGITEASLTRSADGRYLTLAGYDADVATAAVATTTTPTIPARVIARIGADDVIDTSTAVVPTAVFTPRSAVSSNGTDLWMTGSTGLMYATLGGTPALIGSANLRMVNIADGQLYASRSQANGTGINKLGTGLPTMGTQTVTLLPGFPPATTDGDPYAFFALDMNPDVPGIDTFYIADNGAARGVQRWRLNNNTWTNTGTFGMTTTSIGLTGYVLGSKVVMLAVVRTPASAIIKFEDDGTTDPATITPTTMLTAPTRTAYRGIALLPIP